MHIERHQNGVHSTLGHLGVKMNTGQPEVPVRCIDAKANTSVGLLGEARPAFQYTKQATLDCVEVIGTALFQRHALAGNVEE